MMVFMFTFFWICLKVSDQQTKGHNKRIVVNSWYFILRKVKVHNLCGKGAELSQVLKFKCHISGSITR